MEPIESNIRVETIQGTEYDIHKLSYRGETYVSEPTADPEQYHVGKQIGRTEDGMRIYQVKGDSNRIMMTGIMFL